MKRKSLFMLLLAVTILSLMLTACNSGGGQSQDTASQEASQDQTKEADQVEKDDSTEAQEEAPATVTIEDATGQVEVPVNPEKIVALDNRTFETLADWGVEVQAVPKDVMPRDNPYVQDESVQNIGNHREPDLELIAAIDPDLVIIGQRFASHEEAIRDLVPNATVINLNIDLSEEAQSPGENLVNGFKQTTLSLGQIFQKEDEAKELVDEFEASIEKLNEAYNPETTVMSIVVSGGDIGYSAPGHGRVWGPMYEIFNFTPALQVEGTSSDHKGDDISVEAIAQSDPDIILALDRDAAVPKDDFIPAQEIIEESQALQETTAIQEGNIYFAPADTYTNESIQTFITIFNDLAQALSN